jgi:hypothetical protein
MLHGVDISLCLIILIWMLGIWMLYARRDIIHRNNHLSGIHSLIFVH